MANKAIMKKQAGGAMANYKEQLAAFAQQAADSEITPAGSFISFKAGMITVAGQPVKGNTIKVVILDNIFENAMYEGKYDPNNPQPPVCYAFARDEKELAPHEKSSKPQCETCAACPLNVYGSAAEGNGKACKNIRRLAVVSAEPLTADGIRDGEVMYIKLPVTSVKGWAYYVKGLASTLNLPPFGVVTEVSTVPDPKSQFKVVFSHVENLEDDCIAAALERRNSEGENIMFEYSAPRPEEEKPVQAKGRRR